MSEQLDFISQLSGDQQREFLSHMAEMEYLAKHNIPARPDPKFLGDFIQLQRCWLGWKKETLASFAGVSLSTVERIERGQRVSDRCLDRVAVAVGQKHGAFTKPRVPAVGDEAIAVMERWLDMFEGKRWIDVEPIRKQRQIMAFSECHLYLISGERLDPDVTEKLTALHGYISFVGFIRDDMLIHRSERQRRRLRRRDHYTMVLAHIERIEREAHAVALGGTYRAQTDHPYLSEVSVAVIGFFPKKSDPAAIKRRQLLVPERIEILEHCRDAGMA